MHGPGHAREHHEDDEYPLGATPKIDMIGSESEPFDNVVPDVMKMIGAMNVGDIVGFKLDNKHFRITRNE